MYKLGMIYGIVALLAISVIAGVSVRLIPKSFVELVILGSYWVSWTIGGYLYKKRFGSMVFSDNRHAIRRFMKFLLGVGIVWGPVSLYVGGFPIKNIPLIWNVVIAVALVPLSSMNIIPPLFVGGELYRYFGSKNGIF